MSTLYAVPDVLWYRPTAIAVSQTGLIATSAGSSITLSRIDTPIVDAVQPAESPEETDETESVTTSNEDVRKRLVFLKKINLYNEKCNAIAFSPAKLDDGEWIALLLDQSVVKVIDYPSMETVFNEKYTSEIRTIRFMNDRPHCLALGLITSEIIIVDMSTKSVQRSGSLSVKIQIEDLQDFDVRNGLAVLGCSKGSAAIVDTRTWKVLNKHKLNSVIRAVAWHPDGQIAAAISVAEKSCLLIGQKEAFSLPLPAKAIRSTYTDKELLTACVCWCGSSLVIGSPWGTVCVGVYNGRETSLKVIPQEVTTKSLCAMVPIAPNLVLTSGIERTLCVWDTQSMKLLLSRPCLAGFVYDMKFHPAGTGALAIASGCGRVCLAKTDQGSLEQIAKHVSVKCRVYCVAWHPTNEMQLAFGTQKGDVFVVDIAPQKTTSKKFSSPQRTGIGSLCFASIPLISEHPIILAADCNQAFVGKSKNGALISLDMFIKDLAKHKIWSVDAINDRNLLFLGTRQGKVLTIDTSALSIISETILEKHAAQRTVISANGTYLAAVFGNDYFSIFNVDQLVKADMTHPVVPIWKIVGHSCTALCWNPFKEDEFAIGGINGSVQVRKIGTSRILKTLNNATGHKSIMAMQWSMINEDLVFVGTTGHTVLEVNVAENVEDCAVEVNLTEKPKSERSTNGSSGAKSKSTKSRSLFPFASNAENIPKSEGLEDLLLLQSCQVKGDYSALADKTHMGFYHKDLLQKTLMAEASRHQSKMEDDLAFKVLLTGGNIKAVVERAIQSKQLNYHLLSLTHFVSKDFFLETAKALIDQNKDSDIHSVLALMVATGHTEELVKILCDRFLHKEAISVVLSSCDDDDALKTMVYESWANRFLESAQYERAARCLLACNQPTRALETLNLYADPLSALTAAILAKRCDLPNRYLLVKATRELLASSTEVDALDRLGKEFEMEVFSKLKSLSHLIRSYFEETKPQEDSDSLFCQPQESLEGLVGKAGEFTALDDEFLQELLSDIPPPRTVNQLISHIVLEVAHGSATNDKSLGDTAKLHISNKIGDFEEGKYVHFVMAMLNKTSEGSESSSG